MEELEIWLRLIRAPGIGIRALRKLIDAAGDFDGITKLDRACLTSVGLKDGAIETLLGADSLGIECDLRWLEGPNRHLIVFGSEYYPKLLSEIPSPPLALFVQGCLDGLISPQLAIVGARNPTATGRETARAFACHLAKSGFGITSGLASGIDAAAHRGALDAVGVTLGVCATGLDQVYPATNTQLASEICQRGALISEFPTGTPPVKFNFPRRNRLISGLSLGTLVVEAAVHSGSLITARFAGDQGRDVFAIPGSIHNPLARGCHQLLREGATLVEAVDDILGALSFRENQPSFKRQLESLSETDSYDAPLDKDHKILLDALGFEPTSVDQLVVRTGFKAEAVASMLLILELDGRVSANPGALYSLAPSTAH